MLTKLQQKFWDWLWYRRGHVTNDIVATGRWNDPEWIKAICEDIVEKLSLRPEDVLLDIGCAGGIFEMQFAARVKEITATDKIASMIERANKNLSGLKNVELLCAEAVHIPKPDAAFDKILCYSVLHYFHDDEYLRSFFREMRRLLKKGGVALIGDVPDKDSTYRYTKNGIMRVMSTLINRKITRSFTQAEVIEFANAEGLRAVILKQPEKFPTSQERFDLLIRKEL